MSTVFSKIIEGDIPSYKVAEDDLFYAFLDIRPLKRGHTLVVPKEEIDYFFDVGDDLMSKYILFAKRVAKAIEKVVPCKRIGVSVIGLEVPHSHIHLIPIDGVHDMNFSNDPVEMDEPEMTKLAKSINEVYNKLN